jgi:small subunit ribosomal protein S6
MRHYECVYILDPTLAEEDLGSLSERFRQVVVNQGGSVDGLDRWERRRLAYEIKGKREGVYYVMNFQANPGVESELSRVLRLTDGVLRHIVVQLDELALRNMQTQAATRTPAPPPAVPPAPPPPAPAAQALPAEPETTEPPTTEPETEEATPEAVAASEETQTDET